MSGAVLEPRALKELFPDWKERGVSFFLAKVLLCYCSCSGPTAYTSGEGSLLISYQKAQDPSASAK